ncbi:spore gernimation protein [Xylanibacillus composti]|uniref:Putative spore germination protein YfkT n=1 Tax=Xylanibacillus composti TaxID=1572762 RepID=A0A8J4H5D8_9BACL|nr:endospore germination permease [Xylanibacillus composti]MDT9725732.1 spore gernimation protein [Xylanibacillus composti]GIQ71129.1 putative spore germination protein YfkT [Xylanibacillus composti]
MAKITEWQLILIGAAFILDATLVNVPNQVISAARMDSWLSYCIAFFVMMLPLYLLAKVSHRFPNKDLFEILIGQYAIAGRVLAMGYMLFFFYIFIRDLRMVADFVNLALLRETPMIMVLFPVIVTVILITKGGLETIGRLTEIWFPILVIVIVGICMIIAAEFEYRYLTPMFEYGIGPSLEGCWYVLSYVGEVIAIPFLFTGGTFRFKHGFYALVIGVGSLLLLNFYTVLTLGVHIPQMTLYPTYEMVRQLRITDFLDRFDLPLVGIWLATMLVKIAFSLYFITLGTSRVFRGVSGQLSVTAFGILGAICSIWFFENAISLFNFNSPWTALGLVFQLFLPIVIFGMMRLKRKAASRH